MEAVIMNTASNVSNSAHPHPYYPLGVVIPGLVPKALSTFEILGMFAGTCLCILAPTWLYARRARPDFSINTTLTLLWFVLCGFIHLGLEGYFAYFPHELASHSTLLAQAWKEYSLSDSRYLTADTFVVCMETITAVFWGPLSFVCAWCILTDHPLRHPLQSIISLGQLYGDVLYYATCTFEFFVRGVELSRPEPAYFFGYYVLMNSFWIVIPFCLLVQSTKATAEAFRIAAAVNKAGLKK